MYALMRLAEGLLVAHVVLLVAFLLGSTIVPRRTRLSGSAAAMIRVVCTCAVGLSAFGILIFFLALAGWLAAPVLIVLLLAAPLTVPAITGKLLSRSYWSETFRPLRDALDPLAVVTYVTMATLALPCVLPNNGGDAISYHLAYAQDWANAGRLTIDPFLRVPFYASNFNLFFAVFILFGWSSFVNFLGWGMLLLLALGMIAAIRILLHDIKPHALVAALGVALTAAVVVSPTYLQWYDTAYIDLAIAAMSTLAVLCLILAGRDGNSGWLFCAALVAAFFIGMKYSFIVLVPVFAGAMLIVARDAKASPKVILSAVVVLIVASSPWYARNLLLSGDPVAPVINFAINGSDGIYETDEWDSLKQDLSTKKRPVDFLTAPFRAFLSPNSNDFREPSENALIVLLYLPIVIITLTYGSGVRSGRIAGMLVFVLGSYTAYWFLTASRLRYAMPLYPMVSLALIAACRPWLVRLSNAQTRAYALYAFLLTAFMLLVTGGGGPTFYQEFYHRRFTFTFANFKSEDAYLDDWQQGYTEEQFAIRTLHERRIQTKVYVLGNPVEYFFRRDGFVSFGDWVGPGGFFRMAGAIDAHQAAKYLAGLGARAVLIEPDINPISPQGFGVPFARQLAEAGFCRMSIPGTTSLFFLREDEACPG